MQVAKNHLTPDGVFTMYNYYRQQWLVDRLAGTLDQVYGHPPVHRYDRASWALRGSDNER
jgi:hypothetical protein